MEGHNYDNVKKSVLDHMQAMFEEMEEEMAVSHQEKYTLLEDGLENATEVDELRVAFDQWYSDHVDELDLEYDNDEMWDQAVAHLNE